AGSAGATVSLPISLTAPGGQAAALQWKLTYSPSDFRGVTIGLGPAGSSVNKALACNTGTPGQYACLVSGMNMNTLPNGVLANVNLTISSSTANTSSAVSLVSPVAASAAGDAIPAIASGSTITINSTP